MKIYSPEVSAKILEEMESIMMGNNGYANLNTNDQEVISGLRDAGYTVILTKDTFGRAVYRGFTAASQQALKEEFNNAKNENRATYAVDHNDRAKPFTLNDDGVDYEALILDRQEKFLPW